MLLCGLAPFAAFEGQLPCRLYSAQPMIRRDRQAPRAGTTRQRSGVVPRGSLRRERPSTARRDWLGGVIVAVLAVMVLAVVAGVFGRGGEPSAPGAAVSSPTSTVDAGASTPGAVAASRRPGARSSGRPSASATFTPSATLSP